jgi:hypothetical protein
MQLGLVGCGQSTGAPASDASVFDGSSASDTGSSDSDRGISFPADANGITSVYVTLVGHLEDSQAYAECATYPKHREKLLTFAGAIQARGLPFNLQSDYEFFAGAKKCETEAMKASTGGKNILDYLAQDLGWQIDAHQEGATEEGADNYADVRYVGVQVTPQVSEVAGGIVWDDADQLARLGAGEAGWLYPTFSWKPTTIVLGVSKNHHLGDFSADDRASGVWRPKSGGDAFWTNDPQGPLIYVGPGQQHNDWGGKCDRQFKDTADYVDVIARYLQTGKLPSGRIYTASLAVPQSVMLDSTKHQALWTIVDKLKPALAAGTVILANYDDVVQTWGTRYGNISNVVPFSAIDPTDYTCP